MNQAIRILDNVLLLVEGLDDINFFDKMLTRLRITGVQVIPVGGVSKLKSTLDALKVAPNFERVRRIGIIRDADRSKSSAHMSVESALVNSGFRDPGSRMTSLKMPEAVVLILSGDDGTGMLESLICKTLIDKEVWRCVEDFIECCEEIREIPNHRLDKARVNTYLSTTDTPGITTGDAAAKGYWDFTHDALTKVRDFLFRLVDS